jgi:hypothetical protein
VNGLQWKPVIYTPANLTVRFDADVLNAADPAPWCQQTAAERLGPGAGHRQVARLASCLKEYATQFRSGNKPSYAAVYFYPDFNRIPPRAMTEIYVVVEDPVTGPMTLARAREMCETPDELSAGNPGITETEVPAGPALRAHRHRKLDPGKRRSRIGEEVAWFICPPGSTQAVMMFTRWAEPVFSKAAMTIADDMAQNFRTEPNP